MDYRQILHGFTFPPQILRFWQLFEMQQIGSVSFYLQHTDEDDKIFQ